MKVLCLAVLLHYMSNIQTWKDFSNINRLNNNLSIRKEECDCIVPVCAAAVYCAIYINTHLKCYRDFSLLPPLPKYTLITTQTHTNKVTNYLFKSFSSKKITRIINIWTNACYMATQLIVVTSNLPNHTATQISTRKHTHTHISNLWVYVCSFFRK